MSGCGFCPAGANWGDDPVPIEARNSAATGDLEGARRSGQTALGLNVAAVIFYVIIWAVIIGVAVDVGSTTNTCYYGRYTCY
ncbi:hypothetical protein EMCRGX_G010496 [Ephydatia muelleri]